MHLGTTLRKPFDSLRQAIRSISGTPCFRDPVADFGVILTPLDALADDRPRLSFTGPYTVENGQYLSLHLGGSTADGVHAVMDKGAPNRLVFSYIQIMAGFRRFCADPRTIGMLGLGGGSLLKFCYEHFPQSRIGVAEVSREVIALREHFYIPRDDHRLSVIEMEGAVWVRKHHDAFDVLLADAFDEGGQIAGLGTRSFYRDCYRALTGRGVLVLNFSGDAWQGSWSALHRIFYRQVTFYRCPDGDNVIAFACKGELQEMAQDAFHAGN